VYVQYVPVVLTMFEEWFARPENAWAKFFEAPGGLLKYFERDNDRC
jgi:hypothetical protein